MTIREEWAINPRGQVMLALGEALSNEPVEAHLTPMGKLIVRLEDGEQQTYAPNRKVTSALRRQDSMLLSEMGTDGVPRARWIPTRQAQRGHGPSFR